MNTSLLLHSASFDCTCTKDLSLIGDKIEGLLLTLKKVRQFEDVILRNDEIYYVALTPDTKLFQHLYERPEGLTRDQQAALRKIVDRAIMTDDTSANFVATLGYHTEIDIKGLICLHKIHGIDARYIIEDFEQWLYFHRYFLGLYPRSEKEFFADLQLYFSELYFRGEIRNTLKTLTPSFSNVVKGVIHNLSCLNDRFKDFIIERNLPETLKNFSAACNVDATLEGNLERKQDFEFTFTWEKIDEKTGNKTTISCDVCCEPHLKISRSDNVGNTEFYFNRIYFHLGIEGFADAKILVGHIGRHL
jgi:hypothetical protein